MTFDGVMEVEKSIGNGPGSSFLVLSLQISIFKNHPQIDAFQNSWSQSFSEHNEAGDTKLYRKVDLVLPFLEKYRNWKRIKQLGERGLGILKRAI